MLHEGGGGDAGVHADHHVLDALLVFLLHTRSHLERHGSFKQP